MVTFQRPVVQYSHFHSGSSAAGNHVELADWIPKGPEAVRVKYHSSLPSDPGKSLFGPA